MARKAIEPKSLSFERLSGLLLNQNLPKEYITDATEIEFCGKAYTISLSDKTVKVIASGDSSDYLWPDGMAWFGKCLFTGILCG